jgi:flagellar hook protein FlgE
MSLFGAMTSGVSGISAQSSAMAAIADNISNVNTVGYKNTTVDFQTLVTSQATANRYSAGGVQSRPRSAADLQGVLRSSTEETNLAISGDGFFVVNTASEPETSDQFMFTRAGSFYKDNEGYLRNTGGYYLQAWPTDPSTGEPVLPRNSNAPFPNQNIISTEYLETVNLNRVAGSAVPTSLISAGANLPSADEVGASHSLDVQFYNSLGNTSAVSFQFTKTSANNWGLGVEPSAGSAVLTLYAGPSNVYRSMGQLEFTTVPDDGASVQIGGQTYSFANGPQTLGNNIIRRDGGRSVADVVADLMAEVNKDQPGAAATKTGKNTVLLINGTGRLEFNTIPDAGTSVRIAGQTYTFANGAQAPGSRTIQRDDGRTLTQIVADLSAKVNADQTGATLASGNVLITGRPSDLAMDTTLLTTAGVAATRQSGQNVSVDPGLLTADGNPAVRQTAFIVKAEDVAAPLAAIEFNEDGMPKAINVTAMAVTGFADGAAQMDGTADLDGDGLVDVSRIALDFGDPNQASGFTQFGSKFTPGFIDPNGSQFGVLNGISISADGTMSALFDNGERRPIYKLPLATFVNPNGLTGKSGNAYLATEDSGNPTLRVADGGVSGKIEQSALEASTVDIGEEFTNMIVVQRAYSAATKIISTADEMLEELVRIKR